MGFPNEAFPPPDLCSPKRGAPDRGRFITGAARACRSAFARLRMPLLYVVCCMPSPFCCAAARVCGTKRRFRRLPRLSGIPQSCFACACACPPGAARAFSGPKRGGYGTSPFRRTGGGGAHSRRDGPLCVRFDLCRRHLRVCAYWEHNADSRCCLRGMLFRRAGVEKMRTSGAALRENRKKDCPLVPGGFCRPPQRRFFARFGRLRLLAGKHVCVPTALSAADAESRQKSFSARAGAAAGRLRAVDRGLRNSSAGGGHGMRRVMKKYGLSSRAVRFFPIVRRAVPLGLHNITNEMKNRTILRLPFDRLGGGLRV